MCQTSPGVSLMRRHGARTLGIFLLACPLCLPALTQNVGPFGKEDLGNAGRVDIATRYETAPGTGLLVFRVCAEKADGPRLSAGVQLVLTDLANNLGYAQIMNGDAEGVFPNLAYGRYDIEVRAPGYVSTHQKVEVLGTVQAKPIDIVLQRDPFAVNLEVTDNVISPKARKEARHAVSLLTAGDLTGAQKHLQEAYKLAPSSSDVNFLLGYLYFEQKNYAQASLYLSTATTLSPRSAKPLNLLGRTNLLQGNYPAARSALEQAVLADPDNWAPHDLLADAYIHEKNFDKARDQAQIAIAMGDRFGKSAVGPSEVVLGQALIGLGQKPDAIRVLKTFLEDSPQSPLVYQVRSLVAQLEKQISSSASHPSSKGSENGSAIDTSRADPLAAVPNPSLSTPWRPPDIDDVKPTLAPGVTCDTALVVGESGKKVLELVQNLSRFAADEDLFHQSLDAFGFPTRTETRKYDYVALVSPDARSVVSIEESRSDKIPSQAGYPDGIASTGFITLAFVFHPDLQKDFDFACEGQGDWHGQPAWVVHFRQRSDRPNRMHRYNIGQSVPVDLKGRAWITADAFEVVQIEADMVKPLPQIQLLSERQTVEYGPVPFPTKNTTLWLPKKVEIYIDLRNHHYYRRHSFDHYLLFSIDTDEKDKAPENKQPPPEGR